MTDRARLDKIEEILKSHYAEIRDLDVRLPAICRCNSDAEKAAFAEGLRGRAYPWATAAFIDVLKHPNLTPVEPAQFDRIVSKLIVRLAEDATEFFSLDQYLDFPKYRGDIRARLMEDLPKIAKDPSEVNRRRYLGEYASPTPAESRQQLFPEESYMSIERAIGGPSGNANPGAADPTSTQSRKQYFSDVQELSGEFNGKSVIQISGPDDIHLTIYPAPNRYTLALLGGVLGPATDCYLWSIHNRALRSFSNIRFEIPDVQSFDKRKAAFREPIPIGFGWPVLKNVEAGDQTESDTFLRAEGDRLFLGNSGAVLPWPNGDNSLIRHWRLRLKVTGLSEDWLSELDVHWTFGTKTIELMEYSAETRETQNLPMNIVVPSKEHDPNKLDAENEKLPQKLLVTPGSGEKRCFRRTGEVWLLQFDSASVSVHNRIGMAYIEHLLRSPDRLFGCRELQTAVGGNLDGRPVLDKQDEAELPIASYVKDELLDKTARKQYKDRLASIETELQEAQRNNDIGRRERLYAEKQALVEQLKKTTALGGRSRAFADDDERARKAVARAVGTALNKIGKHHPGLEKHLNDRLDRGTRCCYRGDGIPWEV